MTALDAVRRSERLLGGCSLPEVLTAAELQTRVDRKYLLTPTDFEDLVARLRGSHRVLEVGGVRAFRYESIYFDTAGLDSYLGAARGRRRKFKVRTRTYLDSRSCLLEVKREGGREETIKERMAHEIEERDTLGAAARRFVRERVALAEGEAATLEPTLTTTYHRMTLVDLVAGSRITCDAGVRLADPAGRARDMADHVLVETKTAGTAGVVDRLLWRHGVRPVAISKYAVGMAALRPELPANKWHRVLRDHFGSRQEALAY